MAQKCRMGSSPKDCCRYDFFAGSILALGLHFRQWEIGVCLCQITYACKRQFLRWNDRRYWQMPAWARGLSLQISQRKIQ